MSHKLMLRILYHNKPTTSSVIIDTVDLLAALSETLYMQKIIPRSEWCEDGWAGCIEQIEQSEPTNTLSMFIYKFHDATQCSKANGSDFANVFLEHSNPRKYPEGVDRNVAWSFYSLNSAADDTSSVIIDTVDLLAALSETLYMQKIIPRSEWCEDGWAGCIEQIEQSEPTNTLSMFIYKFHDATQCSKANGSDFANVFLEHSNPRKYPEGVDRNVAWSFYSLNSAADDSLEKYFKGEFNEIPTDNFTFPTPVEFQRRDCLLLSIQRQYPNISVKFVDSTSQTQCHCQFTGGGPDHAGDQTWQRGTNYGTIGGPGGPPAVLQMVRGDQLRLP